MERVELTADTVGPIARGHPWVYADGVKARPAVGALVQLVDGAGKPVGFGLGDGGEVAVRVLGRHPEALPRLLERRFAEAVAWRERCLPAGTTAFRLVNGAGDGLPELVVDRYGPVLVLRVYSAAWVPHLDAVAAALRAAVPGAETLLRRNGVRAVDGESGAVRLWGPPAPEPLVVTEAGLRFLVRPVEGQKTGLFLDQRENRRFVAGLAAGLDVVNLFSYSGGFSVHAAAAGARRVWSVDIAPAALEDAKENFRLNGLDPARHVFVAADAFTWAPETPPGLLVCDPPSLSHGRGADGAAAKAYRDLAARTGALVPVGGVLATASCTARLNTERWEAAVKDGLRKAGRWAAVGRAAEPADHPVLLEHPEARYLKFLALRRRAA